MANQQVETFLNYRSVRPEHLPETGLAVTLVDLRGAEQSELIPAGNTSELFMRFELVRKSGLEPKIPLRFLGR